MRAPATRLADPLVIAAALLIAALHVIGIAAAGAEPQPEPAVPARVAEHLAELDHFGRVQIELGLMAAHRSPSEAVRQYAHQLVADHHRTRVQIRELARQLAVDLSRHRPDRELARRYRQLRATDGPELERLFLHTVMEQHDRYGQRIDRVQPRIERAEVFWTVDQAATTLGFHVERARALLDHS